METEISQEKMYEEIIKNLIFNSETEYQFETERGVYVKNTIRLIDKKFPGLNKKLALYAKELEKDNHINYQKLTERHLLYEYLEYKKCLHTKIIDFESPDFICNSNGKQFGVEILTVATNQERMAEVYAKSPFKYEAHRKEEDKNKVIPMHSENTIIGFSPNESPLIMEQASIIPIEINKKLNKIEKWNNANFCILVVDIRNPLIDIKIIKGITTKISMSTNIVKEISFKYLCTEENKMYDFVSFRFE